ncbi:MAG: CAP domain-containing protein [Ktedonobacteraceae bacterium]
MMAVQKQLWPIIAIFLLFALAACSSGFDAGQAGQANVAQTPLAKTTSSAAAKATPAAAIQINIVGKPRVPTPKPSPTAKPAVPGTGNNGSSSTPTSQAQQLAQYVFGLINHDRVAMGLPAYSWSKALSGGAHLHNLRMMAYGQLSHQCPGEAGLGTRITDDGIAWRAAGENIGWSDYPDPQQGVLSNHQSMMAEKPPDDGHRQNILSTSFNLIGIDVLVDAHQNVWLTEDFAQV